MNLRLNLFLILITVGLAAWAYSLYYTDDGGDLSQLIRKDGEAQYTGERLSTLVFDLQGKPQYFAEALEIKRFDESERTEFLSPVLELFNAETAEKAWRLSANQAEITKEKLLHLNGNVILQSLDKTARLQRIESEQLTVDLTTQDIYTEREVKTQGLGILTTGTGLIGNLKTQVATLTKNVKTSLEPTVLQTKQSGKE